MIQPNQLIIGDWGLHKFKDGVSSLVKLHRCGDWQTVRPPTEAEIRYFKEHGKDSGQLSANSMGNGSSSVTSNASSSSESDGGVSSEPLNGGNLQHGIA